MVETVPTGPVTTSGSSPLTPLWHRAGMADLSFMLTRALARGRADGGVPANRSEVLLWLLRKRAEAHRQGLREQEQKLRDQITWALPIEEPLDAD
jgi:hypothetical protein